MVLYNLIVLKPMVSLVLFTRSHANGPFLESPRGLLELIEEDQVFPTVDIAVQFIETNQSPAGVVYPSQGRGSSQ